MCEIFAHDEYMLILVTVAGLLLYFIYLFNGAFGADVAHSVYRRAEGWTTKESEFCLRQKQEIFLCSVHAYSGSHSASYPVSTEGTLPCGKRRG
jgi:hypothetical protein